MPKSIECGSQTTYTQQGNVIVAEQKCPSPCNILRRFEFSSRHGVPTAEAIAEERMNEIEIHCPQTNIQRGPIKQLPKAS